MKFFGFTFFASILLLSSCEQTAEIDPDVELNSLTDGLKVSSAVGYGAATASWAFNGRALPEQVTFSSISSTEFEQSAIITIDINEDIPIPFNQEIGEMTIFGVWEDNQGLLSILMTDIDMTEQEVEFIGLYTVPVIMEPDGTIKTLFAEQDIVTGEGNDTLTFVSFTKPWLLEEMDRFDQEPPQDAFAAVTQNIWYLSISNNSTTNFNQNTYEVSGGGQIAQSSQFSASVMYHALIEARFSLSVCDENPHSGAGFIQNVEAGTIIDLGNVLLDFNNTCNGTAQVRLATGKFSGSFGQDIFLNLD